MTSWLRIGRPGSTKRNEHRLLADEQTPSELRRDQLLPTPTETPPNNRRRLAPR
ncbi:MAG TPA: hypothetical protein VF026_09475 [Ktedonobacteraceae bacterium]